MTRTLNLACGEVKITGAINVDSAPESKADLLFDIRKPFPLASDSFDEVYLFHAIEHIEYFHQGFVLAEIHRVLKSSGSFYLAYPEFETCLRYWLENKNNDRPFWEATIYGRQKYPGDYHYTPIITGIFKSTLRERGFVVDKCFQEPGQDHNTVLHTHKAEPMISYEQLLYQEIFAQ